MSNIINLESDIHFNTLRNEYTILVIDCWAEWCVPCKRISPRFEKLSETYSHNKNIVFIKHNIDNNFTYLPHVDDIEHIPMFFIYSNDTNRYRKFSGSDFDKMENLIKLINDKIYKNDF